MKQLLPGTAADNGYGDEESDDSTTDSAASFEEQIGNLKLEHFIIA